MLPKARPNPLLLNLIPVLMLPDGGRAEGDIPRLPSEVGCDACFVVQFGNHFLLERHDGVEADWVKSAAEATLFIESEAIARAAVARERRQIYQVKSWALAILQQQARGQEKAKLKWLDEFVEKAAVQFPTIPRDGLWTNAHFFFGMRLSIDAALEQLGKSFNLKPVDA